MWHPFIINDALYNNGRSRMIMGGSNRCYIGKKGNIGGVTDFKDREYQE